MIIVVMDFEILFVCHSEMNITFFRDIYKCTKSNTFYPISNVIVYSNLLVFNYYRMEISKKLRLAEESVKHQLSLACFLEATNL